ncbi:hypothetical protein [Hansschlegelia zhihuaiae]|uniref:Uncharacterized protein n=1 Tax=Hansschlegelia zhihuaiae TaxID=405005 RepID=A0A4Q0MIK0_9HYPH|nr:hypothetical protein [Hansschlegelia zhihuaiae]RXF72869.1 hypothetical protein EK403_13665 [Hansschlegelia zhihuaiae]
MLVSAAKKAAESQGYEMKRVPGRGLSNVWNVKKGDKAQVASIRTTRDRWIAFPPLDGGKRWKTLSGVDLVIVAAVDSKEDPRTVDGHIFPADEVRSRFDAAYAARRKDGQTPKDGFGMWVALDRDERGLAASVGSGIGDKYKSVATYSVAELIVGDANVGDEAEAEIDDADETHAVALEDHAGIPALTTISEVVAWARQRISKMSGAPLSAVKLDLKIEY